MRIGIALLFGALAACSVENPAPLTDAQIETNRFISLCSAGFSSSVETKLEAEIKDQGGTLTATLARETSGAIFAAEGMSGESLVELQENFVECLASAGAF